jgi:CheY-like chemotaxis protein
MEERSYDLCTERYEIWNPRTSALPGPRRVLIAHSEANVGDSFALLLAMRGFEAVQVGATQEALGLVRQWQPQVLFVDTLVGDDDSHHAHGLARVMREALSEDGSGAGVPLLIALAANATRDPRDSLFGAGYDGFCRTPCPVWWMYGVLKCFYA